ncbi:DUF2505 domain-containing protein [Tenggerimyces flavus]|uniref:DUF2505 domain-containing protein n=1 Tax=Tenggerimyces flavus TaxID=1708749 RepID=A0ABV7YQH9_9ACTN|nr:DUF2505 domain-containing protein [Tenggerimyces flavus]MBM7786245.1 uncharacterized protein YndB with AHSA1/START domain [Tenggerimyces flavus]
MDLHRETRYDADPAAVYAMLTDEVFLTRWVSTGAALSYSVTVTPTSNGGANTRTQQSLPARVPDFMTKLVGESIDLDQSIDWGPAGADGSRTGQISIDVAKAPVTMRGTMTLVPDGTGTRQVVEVVIKASVPIIGKKIEEAAAPAVRNALELQERLGQEWLASRG